MDELQSLQAMGLGLPSPAYLTGAIIFGVIGFVGFRYGQKMQQPITKWLGVALMLYPYAISETWQLYAVGVGLCGAMYYWRG